MAVHPDAEIGELFGVSRQAVAKARGSYKPPIESPRRRGNYRAIIPWTTAAQHLWDYYARMLRLDARDQTGGELTTVDRQQLDKFRRRLDETGQVVDYMPEGGHFLVARRRDDKGYVRRP